MTSFAQGKRSWGLGAALDAEDMEDSSPPPKKQKQRQTPSAVASTGKMSFAERMMAKMGHVKGQGLGKDGGGIIEPIEQKVRGDVKAGLGPGEKTQQTKREERRAAERRGESYEDSSEEERKRKKERKAFLKAQRGSGSGTSTPKGFMKPKQKYKTATELEEYAGGLHVPNVLKSLIDATGPGAAVLTSTSGLMKNGFTPPESQATKIARRAKRDLEMWADEWANLKEREKSFSMEEVRLEQDIENRQKGIDRLQIVCVATDALRKLEIGRPYGEANREEADHIWENVVTELEALEIEFSTELEAYSLPEVAVAAIQPIFRHDVELWEPLEEPSRFISYFTRLRTVLGIKPPIDINALSLNLDITARRPPRSTTPFETLLYTLWLPRLRTVITNNWSPQYPQPLIDVLTSWQPILPSFIYHHLLSQQILPKIAAALQTWSPRKSSKPPHIFIAPWLPHLPAAELDPSSSASLLAHCKRSLRTWLSTWPLSTTELFPGLETWSSLLPTQLPQILLSKLLPRLATHLSRNLTIDPSDQDMKPLQHVLLWIPYFSADTFAELLRAEFFPKWHDTLYQWLTAPSVQKKEVATWFQWWKTQIPAALAETPVVKAEFATALKTMSTALAHGPAALLPPSKRGPLATPLSSTAAAAAASASATKTRPLRTESGAAPKPPRGDDNDEPTFRDVLEAWAAEHDLQLIAERKAHPTTGAPLFRLTASYIGRGGALCFLEEAALVVQDRADRERWRPMALDKDLVERAGGVWEE